ncbi:unnamed protein product, partial [Ectocarpus sp. 12 AP-2014]
LASISKRPFAAYSMGRLERIFYPMVLWSYIFLSFKFVAGQAANQPVGLEDVLVLPVPGILHFWFLWDLLLISLAFYPLRYLIREGALSKGIWALVVLGIVVLQFLPLSEQINYWIGSALRNMPYFLLGIMLGYFGVTRGASVWHGVLGALVFVALLYAWPEIAKSDYRMFGSLVLVGCFIFVCAGVEPLLPQAVRRWLAALGVASMAIYVMHTIFSAVLREVLQALNVVVPFVHLVGGTLVGIAGPLILLVVFRWLGVTRALGLEGKARPNPPI